MTRWTPAARAAKTRAPDALLDARIRYYRHQVRRLLRRYKFSSEIPATERLRYVRERPTRA